MMRSSIHQCFCLIADGVLHKTKEFHSLSLMSFQGTGFPHMSFQSYSSHDETFLCFRLTSEGQSSFTLCPSHPPRGLGPHTYPKDRLPSSKICAPVLRPCAAPPELGVTNFCCCLRLDRMPSCSFHIVSCTSRVCMRTCQSEMSVAQVVRY